MDKEHYDIFSGKPVGRPILMTMGAFLSIALYNVVELTFLIFLVFKRWQGLYFWSLLVATWGIVFHIIGFIFRHFEVISQHILSMAMMVVGWPCMVTGQSLVLYSRLHLVVQHKRMLRWVLYMVIFNGVVLHVPVIVLALGSEATHLARFARLFCLYEKVQIVIFFVQEAAISIIYIYETVRLLGSGDHHNEGPLRKLLGHLIFVNVVVLVLDATLLATEFTANYDIQATFRSAIYSVKLKIEFSVLNRLVYIVKNKHPLEGPGSLGNASLHLRTWNSSNKPQYTISTSGEGSFVVNNNESGIGDEKGPIVKASAISVEEDCNAYSRQEAQDSEPISKAYRKPDITSKAHGHNLD